MEYLKEGNTKELGQHFAITITEHLFLKSRFSILECNILVKKQVLGHLTQYIH